MSAAVDSKLYSRMDKDGDGKWSHKEYVQYRMGGFKKMDKNNDAMVDASEAWNAKFVTDADSDKNEKVSSKEAEAYHGRVAKSTDKDGHKYHGATEMLQFMKDKYKNEPFTFSIEGKSIAGFLRECGHKIIRHLNQNQIEATYLKKADGSSIGKPNGLLNMIITSPEV